MLLHGPLGDVGTPPTRLEVDATLTFDQVDGDWRVVSSALKVVGTVPGLDAAVFQSAAQTAKDGCPISKMMTGNVTLSVKAMLA